ncbi:Mu transposase C-terminal domain-containing protein, partial [Methylobacterium goesingense]|uniref:Mu transposase C-terminal domain-containing protein n=1 Tax=Methylobacterium goesingense TaxID=243690 RepID=UPI001EE1705F
VLTSDTKESFYHTLSTQSVARLPGKTFHNVVALGEYDKEGRTCIETPELAALLTRWIVDTYHGTPHDGLAGETPHDAWNRLARMYGLQPAPDRNKVRSIFGIPLSRKLGNGGIRVLGLRYWCEPLKDHFLGHGFVDMEVKLDPEDMAEISVRIGNAWHVASCTREGFEDVTMEAWIRTSRDLASKHAAGAVITEGVVHAAIRAANLLTKQAMARAGISALPPTAEDVVIAEREVMLGWTMPDKAAPGDVGKRPDPLDGGIPVTGPDDLPSLGTGSSKFTVER